VTVVSFADVVAGGAEGEASVSVGSEKCGELVETVNTEEEL
jgi:hypothetical protein